MTLTDAVQQEAFWAGVCFTVLALVACAMIAFFIWIKLEDIKEKAIAEHLRMERESANDQR